MKRICSILLLIVTHALGAQPYSDSPSMCFDAYFTALILQPSASNLDYSAQANPFNYDSGDVSPAVSPSWTIQEIEPGYHFGFDMGIVGAFCTCDAFMTLNWVRYHSPYDSTSQTAVGTSMVGPFFEIGPDASLYKVTTGKTNFHFDEVNLDFGTNFCFRNKCLLANFFAGAGFMRLLQNLESTFAAYNGNPSRTISVPAKFTGAGPQLGFGFEYATCRFLQFVGSARSTLYVGNLHNETNYSTASSTLIALGDASPNYQSTKVTDRAGLVPSIETYLGLASGMSCFKSCRWKLEAGYRTQVYFNVLRSIDMGSEVNLAAPGAVISADTGVYARTFLRTISNFALFGPYASVAFNF